MKLYIDTASGEHTTVKIGERGLIHDSSVWRSQVVLPMIKKLLRAQKLKLSDVTEIEVNLGPGSFTGLRVGASIANALGYALKIPVNGKRVDQLDIVEPRYE